MSLPKLPISIQHFEVLRQENYLYIDKTKFVYELMDDGGAFFLSRPRRFGKSLFVSTLAAVANGERALFENTWIEDKWDWQRKYPILHFQFASIGFKDIGLEAAIVRQLKIFCKMYAIETDTNSVQHLFVALLTGLSAQKGKIVLLIDEYDKPIISYMEEHKQTQALENQEIMRNFYGVLKDFGNCLHLTFITGVSKFSRVSLFSEVNHLEDLTLDTRFATALGYTQREVEDSFEAHIQAFLDKNTTFTRQKLLEKVKIWYNGYSWDGTTTVYNPFALLNFFKKRQFTNHWFATGTPLFLTHVLLDKGQTDFENTVVSADFLEQYSLENMQSAALLFQTGYLTIKDLNEEDNTLVLDFPNFEVQQSFYQYLMSYLGQKERDSRITMRNLGQCLEENDLSKAYYIMQDMFNVLPYEVYKASNEALYHGLVHILFHYLGLNIESEVHTKYGRLDAVVQTTNHVYIMEFKYNKTAAVAMQQIKQKDYASKYRESGKIIVGIGINFVKKSRSLDEWVVEIL